MRYLLKRSEDKEFAGFDGVDLGEAIGRCANGANARIDSITGESFLHIRGTIYRRDAQICINCRWSFDLDFDLECRRYPKTSAGFPPVALDEFCGEFADKRDARITDNQPMFFVR